MTYHTPHIASATRHDGWTPERQAIFLRELAATHCVATAARAAGMSRQAADDLRARSKGEPFDRAWQAALLNRFDVLAEAALERALNGVEVPHFYRGEQIGTSRKFDERLTVALLAMRDSFRPMTRPDWDPASRYAADDFGPLVDRVERGPATWLEESRAISDALYADEDLADYCDDMGNEDEDDGY